jgi:hypothetical protein
MCAPPPPLLRLSLIVFACVHLLHFSLRLYTKILTIQEQQKKRKFKNEELAKAALPSLIDFDPAVLLLEDLRHAYGHAALFFHDRLGGSNIGIVWNPAVRSFSFL